MIGKRQLGRLAGVAGVLAALAGCATSGPTFAEAKANLPAITPDQGRIFFYRTAVIGAAVQPAVKLNDVVVGSAVPRGYFYADRPAGSYTVSTTTEVTRTLSLTLAPGQIRYVQLNIGMGFFIGHVYPELVDDAAGQADIANCHAI